MPLSKAKGNMYDWCTHTHSHMGGECPHKCSYCYVAAITKRFGNQRYAGKLRLEEHEFDVKYGKGKTIFIEHCNDLFAEAVPTEWIERILYHCRQYPDNTYVFQSKNPARMINFLQQMPPDRMLGCTIETIDAEIIESLSDTPAPSERYYAMRHLTHLFGERAFVTIEPILQGDMLELARWMSVIEPEFVNIGADSKGTGLTEPTGDDVRALLLHLEEFGVTVRQKSNLERLLKK